jgi:hypothetical protein
VNFIDKEDIAFLKAGEESSEVAGFFDRGTGGGANGGIHFRAEDVGESGFPKSGRTTEKKVVEGLGAGSGRIEKDAEPIFEFGLAGKVGKSGGAERLVDSVAGGGVEFFEWLG